MNARGDDLVGGDPAQACRRGPATDPDVEQSALSHDAPCLVGLLGFDDSLMLCPGPDLGAAAPRDQATGVHHVEVAAHLQRREQGALQQVT